ncbi:CHAT domain-containing protein [Nemania sp. NC0429]|nr:CHAT domain-containing protein [Nemania sp. NC0429]
MGGVSSELLKSAENLGALRQSYTEAADKLVDSYEQSDALPELDEAIRMTEEAIKTGPLHDEYVINSQASLVYMLGMRFQRTDVIGDFNRAVELANTVIAATPPGSPRLASRLNNLGNLHGIQFRRTGLAENLNCAIEAASEALDAESPDHPGRAVVLTNLGTWLGTRFERTENLDDLNSAIHMTQEAMATPSYLHDQVDRLNNIALWLGRRFERLGDIEDLNHATKAAAEALNNTPPSSPHYASRLYNLGYWLGRRFERTGDLNDINAAIEKSEEAVAITPANHPDRAEWFNGLGIWFGRRFERLRAMEDLNGAIKAAQKALEATPPSNTAIASRRNSLAIWLGLRFERLDTMEDLNRAVELAEEAVKTPPLDHPEKRVWLNTLGVWVGKRFQRTGAIGDLHRAIEVTQKALSTSPSDDPDRGTWLNTLGAWLMIRFEQTDDVEDVDRGVEVTETAVKVTPHDHPDRAARLNTLGLLLNKRFQRTNQRQDLAQSISCFEEGWNCDKSPPSMRVQLAQRVARFYAEESAWEKCSILLEGAIELIPMISPRSLQRGDQQHVIADFGSGLASFAAAAALNAGKEAHHALELLEHGRGIMSGLLLDMRTDISDVQKYYPDLAKEFVYLADELDSPSNILSPTGIRADAENMVSKSSQANRRHEASERFPKVIESIRAKPGFQGFLLPPSLDELKAAANRGPIVVINTSAYRCDAFIIEPHQIRLCELPGLSLNGIQENLGCLRESSRLPLVLGWLWDAVTCPILQALHLERTPTDDEWPHIWWIPTGQLSNLPLHAAGWHAQGSSESVIDRVISSYSSSIKSLMYGRRFSHPKSPEPTSKKALLIAMQETPGLLENPVLRFAAEEGEILEQMCPSLNLEPIRPLQRRKDVLSHLGTCEVFHFAGHGRLNPREPSQSSLLLEDWETEPLTVVDLRDLRLQEKSPFLAYLSACSTGTNNTERLADETIHLISACQLAGFPHVVGTLWEVDDMSSVYAAREVYEAIRDRGWNSEAVAFGVHKAGRVLRDDTRGFGQRRGIGYAIREEGDPLIWAAYVHVGS